jgi:hypothetical protein
MRYSDKFKFSKDTLEEVLGSGLPWGLILYGEEEETLLAKSKDPILAAIWQVSSLSYLAGEFFILSSR